MMMMMTDQTSGIWQTMILGWWDMMGIFTSKTVHLYHSVPLKGAVWMLWTNGIATILRINCYTHRGGWFHFEIIPLRIKPFCFKSPISRPGPPELHSSKQFATGKHGPSEHQASGDSLKTIPASWVCKLGHTIRLIYRERTTVGGGVVKVLILQFFWDMEMVWTWSHKSRLSRILHFLQRCCLFPRECFIFLFSTLEKNTCLYTMILMPAMNSALYCCTY